MPCGYWSTGKFNFCFSEAIGIFFSDSFPSEVGWIQECGTCGYRGLIALTGFSHVDCPDGLNNTLLKAAALEQLPLWEHRAEHAFQGVGG